MSRSRSSQSTQNSYTTTNVSNILDGGAIKSAFDFADEAFDSATDLVRDGMGEASTVSKAAIASNESVTENAFDFADELSSTAFDSINKAVDTNADVSTEALQKMAAIQGNAFELVDELTTDAVSSLKAQNTAALSSLSAMQAQTAVSNKQQLETMTSLVKSVQTQGATELIDANKAVTIGVVVAVVIGCIIMLRGKK